MHNKLNRLENNKDLIILLKNNGYGNDLINFILGLNDENFESLKKYFSEGNDPSESVDLLTTMSKKEYNSANQYIIDKFYGIKNENSECFKQYKEFIILLLDQEFSDDRLLRALNQISRTIVQFNDVTMSNLFNQHFLEHKDVYVTFFKYLLPHSCIHEGSSALEVLVNHLCEPSKLDNCKSNLPLFRLLVQNDFLRSTKRYQRTNSKDYLRFIFLNVTGTLLEMNNFKEIKVKDSKELLDLLLARNLITLDQDKRDFIAQNPLASHLLNAGYFTILELIDNPLEKIKERVEKLTSAKIKEAQAQSNLPDTHNAEAPNLAEQVAKKLKNDQDKIPSLLTLSACAIINPQKTLDSPHKQ